MGAIQQVMLGLGGAASPTLDPSVLGGYDWDLNPDAISGSDSDPLVQLPDVAGGGFHFGQATGANQPLLRTAFYNGHNAVEFAAGKFLVPDPSAFQLSLANTLICVCTPGTVAAYILRGDGGQGGPAFITGFNPGSGVKDFEYFFTSTAGHERATFAASASGLCALTVCKTDDTGNYTGYLNDNPTPVFSNAIHTGDDWDPRAINRIGIHPNNPAAYDGRIARVIHYSQDHQGTPGLFSLLTEIVTYFGI